MSDAAQILVAIDCPPQEAEPRARAVLGWLLERHIVQGDRTVCVLGPGGGYAPGPNFTSVLEDPSDPAVGGTRRSSINGMAVITERTVFDSAGNGIELACSRCGAVFRPGPNWGDAVEDWWEGNDDARYGCPSCAFEAPLGEWSGPWPWAFGYLGMEFWNWPPLSDRLVEQVATLVGGRVRVVRRHV